MMSVEDLSTEERRVMLHAVGHLKTGRLRGRAKKLRSCYRNFYAAGDDIEPTWDALAARGLARGPYLSDGCRLYRVTEAGFAALTRKHREP